MIGIPKMPSLLLMGYQQEHGFTWLLHLATSVTVLKKLYAAVKVNGT